jgi:hypothetical protein
LGAVPVSGTEHWSAMIWAAMALGVSVLLGAVLNFLAGRSTSEKLIIHSARYGIGPRFWQSRNVTKTVQSHVKDGSLDLVLGQQNFGDPYVGKPKHTYIKFSRGGGTFTQTFEEGYRLVLRAQDVDLGHQIWQKKEWKRKAEEGESTIKNLRAQLQEETNAKNDREGRLQQLRQQYEAEQAQNAKPKLIGDIVSVKTTGMYGEGHDRGDWHCHSMITFKAYLCNQSPTSCTLRAIEFDGSETHPAATFANIDHNLVPSILEHGIGRAFEIMAWLELPGRWNEIDKVDLSNLKVYALDSFGARHQFVTPQGLVLQKP